MTDQNARFLVYLKKLGEKRPAGYRVAHIHVSELPGAKKSRDNLSRAIASLGELKAKYKDGEIFLMKSLDIIFVSKETSKPLLAAACDTIQQIFLGQMGVAFTNEHGGVGEFYTLFDLGQDFSKVLAWAEGVAGMAGVGQPTTAEATAGPKGAIDLTVLSRIKDEIDKVDITPMLFNQPVYSIQQPGRPIVMFQEMYISVQVLEDTFCPGLSLTSRRWLFADLTEDLDTVVLRLLADPEERGRGKRISINVNLSTLASPRFVKFDAELPAERRSGVVLEINKTDIIENIGLYRELVPFLRQRGYRLLLDGLTLGNLSVIDLEGIDCDFAKLFWSGETQISAEELTPTVIGKLRNRREPLFVLARCDTAGSIRFAKEMGIRMVQGRLVDHMVKKNIPF